MPDDSFNSINSKLGHCENFLFLLHFFCNDICRQCIWLSLSYEQYIIHIAHTLCLGTLLVDLISWLVTSLWEQ